MKTLCHCDGRSCKGAALMIVLAFVVLLTGLVLAYFTRTSTERRLAHSSYNDTWADLLAQSALDIVVDDLKQEIINGQPVTATNIQPMRYGDASIPNLIRRSFSGDPTNRTSSVSSSAVCANGRSISTSLWNSHYLVPRGNPSDTTANPSPTPTFIAPDWVLVTPQGPAPAPASPEVVGRYAFAVYDEGGLLDMNLAGSPNWPDTSSGCPNPSPSPWQTNTRRKGIVAFADLTALPAAPTTFLTQPQIDNIVGWRNYATTQRAGTGFGSFTFTADCAKQDNYASYLLDFGDPPFTFDSSQQPVPIASYPFSCVAADVFNSRTDQAFMTRQELLRLRSSLDFSQNVLQYMGTFSRERNKPAPDWPHLGDNLSEGRFCLDNLDLVKPNPENCTNHGRHKGQGKSRGRGHLCGTQEDIVNLFGLLWIKSSALPPDPNRNPQPGYWRYIAHNGPQHDPNPNANGKIPCFRGGNKQNDFFQVLSYALFRLQCAGGGDADPQRLAKTFAIGASLIDQYDSDADDLDTTLTGNNKRWQTHTTMVEYAPNTFAYGMETSDVPYNSNANQPRRPYGAPDPVGNPVLINRAFTNVGEFGYGIVTSDAGQPSLDFRSTGSDAPVLDFFGYNPVSSSYPRAGIINLNTKNAPVLAAVIKGAVSKESTGAMVAQTAAMNAAQAIVNATSTQPALTRADVARLASVAGGQIGSSEEEKETIARALAEVGQTRAWNLFIDVIAQTGRYAPRTISVRQAEKFTVEGEKRYWLHIALGRDLNADGTVDVLGTQLEEVLE